MSKKENAGADSVKNETTGLSLPGTFTQEDVSVTLKKIDAQLAALSTSKSEDKVGDTVLPGVGALKDLKKPSECVAAIGSVRARAAIHKETVEAIGDDCPQAKNINFSLAGHSAKVWEEALKSRLNELANAAAIKKLKETRKTLEGFVSEEEKRAAAMAAAVKSIQDFKLD